jgi:hypothetical protein
MTAAVRHKHVTLELPPTAARKKKTPAEQGFPGVGDEGLEPTTSAV